MSIYFYEFITAIYLLKNIVNEKNLLNNIIYTHMQLTDLPSFYTYRLLDYIHKTTFLARIYT